MEQRTLLAIALSLLVLLVYNSLLPRQPNKAQLHGNYTQQVDIKQDMANNSSYKAKMADIVPSGQPKIIVQLPPAEEKLQTFDNDNVTIEASSFGGSLSAVTIKKNLHKMPLTRMFEIAGYNNADFQLEKVHPAGLTYSYSDDKYKIVKKYDFADHSGGMNVVISITNISEMSKLEGFDISNFIIDSTKIDPNVTPASEKSLFEYSVSKDDGMLRKGNAFAFSPKELSKKSGAIKWSGFRDRFFCAIIKPNFKTATYSIEPVNDKNLKVSTQTETVTLNPGETATYNFEVYFGLQDPDILKGYHYGFEEIVSFSSLSIVDFISKGIVKLMGFVHRVIPSWGTCIVIMCVLVYLAMYPLTLKGMMSMRKMQTLQPKMAQLREQYKNQPQKLNKEIMELYKEHKVNPFGGCFPFILQMPVFIGLYQALWRTVYLKGASFLWIKDLSEPDRLLIFPTTIPLVGNELNILPLIMAIIMFFQQKFSAKNIVSTDPAQIAQQKMMAVLFPIMLGFIFYKFASGLTLYFTVFYLFSAFTQWKMSKVV